MSSKTQALLASAGAKTRLLRVAVTIKAGRSGTRAAVDGGVLGRAKRRSVKVSNLESTTIHRAALFQLSGLLYILVSLGVSDDFV